MAELNHSDALTYDDRARLTAIMEATDPEQLAQLVYEYYRDSDRADRTSRSQIARSTRQPRVH